MKIRYMVAIAYLVFFPLTYGGLLADSQNNFHMDCRHDIGMNCALALLPATWVLSPLITGFYEHGLQFTCGDK